MRKEKLIIPRQIDHMKEKGITFKQISEAEAASFLEKNTYYFKVKSYCKNYDKYKSGVNEGKYINLDFAYLKDLSTIDAHLRKLILKMTLDLEHFLKVKLLSDFNKIDEDGYNIISIFLKQHKNVEEQLTKKEDSYICGALINKHKKDWSLWSIVEVLSFSQFIDLYELFYYINRIQEPASGNLMSVRMLRNAAAHNNCLIHHLRPPYWNEIQPNRNINTIMSQIPGINQKTLSKKMTNPTVHDFAAFVYLFYEIVERKTRNYALKELADFFTDRMIRNKSYYLNNEVITSNYKFTKKIVDFYYAKCI